MKHRVSELNMFATPKAERMFDFEGLGDVEFKFPKSVRTVLFIHCGLVRASVRDSSLTDYYEVVGRLYESDNPQDNDERHAGKLYIWVYDYPHATCFKASCELLEWHTDGSFDVITSEGVRHNVTPPPTD